MSVSGADIVSQAAKELGDPYVFGAEGPTSFDCSGLVEYVFHKFGIKTPRVASDQAHFGQAIARKDLRPGDLIFFNFHGGDAAGHVGIYAGDNKMIHAPHTGTVVKKVTLSSYYWANAIGYRRFPGVTGGPATSEGLLGLAGGVVDKVTPDSLTGALASIGSSLGNIASGVASVGKVAELVTKLFLPSNVLRGVAGLMGTMFVLIGIWFLSREARQS